MVHVWDPRDFGNIAFLILVVIMIKLSYFIDELELGLAFQFHEDFFFFFLF